MPPPLWGDESPDIGYQARVFAQTSLPYRDPGSLPVWGCRNGSLSLVVQPGHGFPFGVIPRLLLTWISTEAVRTKDPVLPLGDSLSDFMGQLGLVPTGGKAGRRPDESASRERHQPCPAAGRSRRTPVRSLDASVAPSARGRSALPVHVTTVLGREHRDHAGLLVDGIQHAVAAPTCRPAPR